MSEPKAIALIPARFGSKRIPGKNIRPLAGHPMMAYTISAALESGVFEEVVISTDSEEIAKVGRHYGAEVPFLRPSKMAEDVSPDIEWVKYTMDALHDRDRIYSIFSILRPTSPFRKAATIKRAWEIFRNSENVDSLRAVELCQQHPGKMWKVDGARMKPVLENGPRNPPWHSTPYQALPKVYAQNASLEIAWTRVVYEQQDIAGENVIPFFTEGVEGFDINNRFDWMIAEQLIASGEESLPLINEPPYTLKDLVGI